MKSTVAAICMTAVLFPSLADAATWEVISRSVAGAEPRVAVAIDRASIRERDGYRQGWTRWDFYPGQRASNGRYYFSSLALYHAECRNRALTLSQFAQYEQAEASGPIIGTESYGRESIPKTLQEAPPGTILEAILEALCAPG